MNNVLAVLNEVLYRRGKGPFSVSDVVTMSGENKFFVRRTLKTLTQMKVVVRYKDGYQYRIWETTSLMPMNLYELQQSFEAFNVALRRRLVKGRTIKQMIKKRG